MNIGISARYLQNAFTGIETYLVNTLLNLKKIDRHNQYTLFFSSDKPVPKIAVDNGFAYDTSKFHTGSQFGKVLWAHLYIPYGIKKNKIDVFHEPFFTAPIIKRCPTVITVYDVSFLYIPFCYTFRTRLYLKSLLPMSLKRSDLIIAISKNTKKDIIDNFSISPDKIIVIYPGVEEDFKPVEDREELERVKRLYKIRGDFILSTGGLSPRKNFIRLIKALKMLRDNKKIDLKLVIVGVKGWMYEPIFKEISINGLERDVLFCGHVPKEQLVRLYNAAAAFIYPSLYEGFGMPILEAMACGCPVVASKVSSMPEACGDAALLIDPKNIEALSDAIYKMITDEPLRKDLIRKGMNQAKKFSWQKTAEETLTVYRKTFHESTS